mgnify:FL=1
MNNIGVFKDHDYMDEKDFVINQLEDSLSIQNRHLEESRNEIIVLKQRVQEQASNGVHLVVQLQDELYKLNSLWFNRLYVFITTLRLRNPFYNQS